MAVCCTCWLTPKKIGIVLWKGDMRIYRQHVYVRAQCIPYNIVFNSKESLGLWIEYFILWL